MNPTQQGTEAAPTVVDRNLLREIIEEMEVSAPYGVGKFSDEDATLLGIPSLGTLRLAKALCQQWMGTPFIPKFIAESPNPAGTFVATVIRGNELGFKMMESLSSLYVAPGGRLGMMGTAMIALLRRSGVKLTFSEVKDADGRTVGAQVHGKRKDGDEYTATFTRQDALTAKLGNVHNAYPLTMCRWRAVSDLFRFLASDLSGGPIYTTEELREEEGLDRGDSSNAAFQEEARRQNEAVNEFTVGRKAAEAQPEPPKEEVKLEPEKTAPAPVRESPTVDKSTDVSSETVQPEAQVPIFVPPAEVVAAPAEVKAPEKKAQAAPAQGEKTVGQIFEEIAELIPTVSPEKLKRNTFPEFLRGFTNVGDLKKMKRSAVDPALRILPFIIRDFKSSLMQDPNSAGVMAGAGWNKLMRYFDDSWPADCRDLAIATAIERYSDSGGADIIEYLEEVAQVKSMSPADLRAFLMVFARTNEAILLRKAATKHGKSMVDLVMAMDLDLSKATKDEVDCELNKILAGGVADPAESDSSAEDEEDALGLFD